MIIGGPKTVLAQIKRLNQEIGCGMLNLIFDRSGAPDKKRRSIELFAKEVMPAAREI